MTEPTLHQEPEGISSRAIGWTALGVVVLGIGLIVIAWLLVVPPPASDRAAITRSPLQQELIEQAAGGDEVRTAGAHQLERYQWVDRKARVVRIPIDRAIDAVVADPQLLAAPLVAAGPPPGVVGAVGPGAAVGPGTAAAAAPASGAGR